MIDPRVRALILSLALCVLLLETGLRVWMGPPIHWRWPQESYRPDATMGHRLVPSQRAFTHDKPVFINSLGVRDEEHEKPLMSGDRRILAIGDSQTFGLGLSLEDTWPKRLERTLALDIPSVRWRLINAGIPATDTWQHELWLQELIDPLKPDLVILAFYVNDVTERTGLSQLGIVPEESRSRQLIYLAKRSAIISALLYVREPLRMLLGRASDHARREDNIISGAPDPVVERGWSQVKSSLAQMNRLSLAKGTRLCLVVLPRRDQIASGNAPQAYNRRIVSIAADLNIPAVDTTPDLSAAYVVHGENLFIRWDGHHSAIANDVIAKATVQAMHAYFVDVSTSAR